MDNVTVTGRVVVWGGGTDAVWMNNGTDVADLIVCRVDGPVKVIFDKDSTLAVYDTIDVTITDRAEAFEETEVIFYDVSGILDEQDKVNAALEDSEISISLPPTCTPRWTRPAWRRRSATTATVTTTGWSCAEMTLGRR